MAEKKLWFKAKRYGYGWYPSTWQGWVVILVWTILFTSAIFIFPPDQSPENAVRFSSFTFIITAILIYISCKKGEPARWRWGK